MLHEFDVREDSFIEILEGNKKHEVRLIEDGPFDTGDILLIKEVGIFDKKHTGRGLKLKVTYITPVDIGYNYKFAIMSVAVLEGINV